MRAGNKITLETVHMSDRYFLRKIRSPAGAAKLLAIAEFDTLVSVPIWLYVNNNLHK
jgi:hypothetical protein